MPSIDNEDFQRWKEFFDSYTEDKEAPILRSFLTNKTDICLDHNGTCTQDEIDEIVKYLAQEKSVIRVADANFLNIRKLEKDGYKIHNFVEIGDAKDKKGMVIAEFEDGYLLASLYEENNKGYAFDCIYRYL
ncbi:hypothetical protein GVAV_003321 [Gurleya vavrai]